MAAFFAPFSWFPISLGSVLWRLLNAAIFLGAIFWWLKAEINRRIPKSSYWLVFLLILPLSLGNFNNGQVNPMIIGLLMVAILAAHEKRWTLSAVAAGIFGLPEDLSPLGRVVAGVTLPAPARLAPGADLDPDGCRSHLSFSGPPTSWSNINVGSVPEPLMTDG